MTVSRDRHTDGRSGVVRLSREERVRQILAAATDEFRASGFDGTSMSAIASRAGIVEGSIYRFFASKAALLTRCIEVWYEEMLEHYAAELARISGTRARLRFMIWRHLNTVHDEPEMCRMMFDLVRSSAGYRTTEVYRLNSLYTARTIDIIREGITAGEFRGDLDLKLVRDMIYGGVEHRITGFLWGHGTLDPDRIADGMVDLVLGGLSVSGDIAARLNVLEQDLRVRLQRGVPRVPEGLT